MNASLDAASPPTPVAPLVAAVSALRTRLERRRDGVHDALPPVRLPFDIDLVFDLTVFEAELLLLCAAVEIDPGFGALLQQLEGDVAGGQPSFGVALKHLSEPFWSAIAPGAPLRYWRLVELTPAATLVSSRLRIDECVLHHLLGVPCMDERLQGLVTPVAPPEPLPPSQAEVAAAAAAELDRLPGGTTIYLIGPEGAGHAEVAAEACARHGLGLERMSAHALPAASSEREELARLWRRHAMLADAALLIDAVSADTDARLPEFLSTLRGNAIVACATVPREPGRAALKLDLVRPTTMEQAELWRSALGPDRVSKELADDLAGQFDLGRAAIQAAAASAATAGNTPDRTAQLRLACRRQARTRLDELAQRIAPRAGWDDLVVSTDALQLLRAIEVQVRGRTQVYHRWGFAERFQRGLGVGALFCGPSGSGKTLAAEVLANGLDLDLYRVDLSRVVSKYIGETEGNLRRIFDAAEAGHAVLLFDEADALFGKRTEVKDSHDRYANIEVSYLLQRMEEYRGLAVLTTNMRDAIDLAFMRRLRFVVDFPFPGPAERERIWRCMFPPAAPLAANLDYARLAQLNLPGGNIRNIALAAAFLAADDGRPIGMAHVRDASRAEYAKLDRPLTLAELDRWT